MHAFLADALTNGRDTALARVPDEFAARCEAIDFGALPVKIGSVAVERALKWRDIPGTVDVVGLTETAVVVIDWKGPRAEVPPAANNLQTGLYAVAAAEEFSRTEAYVAIVRVREDGSLHQDVAHLDGRGLQAMAARIERIKAAVDASAESSGPYAMGEHCRYCPARRSCPAHFGLAVAMGRGDASPFAAMELTPETAMRAYHAIKAGERIVEAAKESLATYLRERGPIVIDGRRLELTTQNRESLDGKRAFAALSRLYGQDVAKSACSIEATKAAIETALRPVAATEGVALSHIVKVALNAIRDDGGSSTKTFECMKEGASA